MDQSIVALAGTLQMIGLAVVAIVGIMLGLRVIGTGAKGFGSLIMEIGGLLFGLWFIARPNDAIGILLKAVGGIQAPTLPH